MVLACVAEESRILKSPAPVCFITAFGDSSVDFQLRFWLCDPQNGITNVRSGRSTSGSGMLLKLMESRSHSRKGMCICVCRMGFRVIFKAPGASEGSW